MHILKYLNSYVYKYIYKSTHCTYYTYFNYLLFYLSIFLYMSVYIIWIHILLDTGIVCPISWSWSYKWLWFLCPEGIRPWPAHGLHMPPWTHWLNPRSSSWLSSMLRFNGMCYRQSWSPSKGWWQSIGSRGCSQAATLLGTINIWCWSTGQLLVPTKARRQGSRATLPQVPS